MSYLQEAGDYSEAESHCLRLMDVGGLNKEKAKALLRDIRALQVGLAIALPSYLSLECLSSSFAFPKSEP